MRYRTMKNIWMFCVLLGMFNVLSIHALQAQTSTKTIDATIVNEDGMALPQVLVSAVNSNDKTFTDSEGNFSLNVSVDGERVILEQTGYHLANITVARGILQQDTLVLEKAYRVDGSNPVELPYNSFSSERSVSSVYTISGEELASYPTPDLLEALSGRIPGMRVSSYNSVPGQGMVSISIRGLSASVYVDGIRRDASNLSAHEVDKVQVIKDMSGRAALGVSGANPVVWITTKKGKGQGGMNVSTEYGISSPTVLPEYLGAYDYARLYNEAVINDGGSAVYDQAALDAYQNHSDPLRYPDVNYYDRYVKDYASFRKANINFAGGDDDVNYFTMLDYNGNSGLEKVGEQANADRYRLRGNIEFQIIDWIAMNVNLSGTYQKNTFPNRGDGAGFYNMFSNVLSTYPSNAHPISYDGKLMNNSDYQTNLTNVLVHGGYGERTTINSQNDANLMIDLDQFIKGLRFKGTVSFNINDMIGIGKGGSEDIYRLVGDSLVRYVEGSVDPNMDLGAQYQSTRTVGSAQLNYQREFGDHALTVDGAFFRAYEERGDMFQPEKLMDYSLRASYAFDKRYVLQLDASYTGSMRLPEGERFTLYPSAGVAWVASNEDFLNNSSFVDYLKFNASYGEMGINDFYLPGFTSPYYLTMTLWETSGSWTSGLTGSRSSALIYEILQSASADYELPTRQYLNVGMQTRVLDDQLSAQLNYFQERNTGLLSAKEDLTPALVGTGGFLSAENFGETKKWGVDGMIQFNSQIGDLKYGIGANAVYAIPEQVKVDEAKALADYRKRAGKDADLLWLYEADGLYQSQEEIDSRDVEQSWGDAQPGDIRYVDYNNDGVVDEKDVHTTGAHHPRLYYGVNLSLAYKGLSLMVQGAGRADGQTQLYAGGRYFKINSTGQNYSELMMDRWPETNDIPRLTTSSQNNVQNSTFWLENAAYFRIQNVELSYTLPQSLSESVFMKDWKIFVRGRNLLTFSEMSDYNIDPVQPYAGIYSYPMLRTITAGFSAKF